MNVLLPTVAFLLGAITGVVGCGWWLFRGSEPTRPIIEQYEVKLTRLARGKAYSRTLYAGDDLELAKKTFKTATGPARTYAELYTRGQHTASRLV